MPAVSLSLPEPDIALLSLDVPGRSVNVFSAAVVEEFLAALDEVEKQTSLAGLVIASGKPSGFIAGADIREFSPSTATRERTLSLCRRGQAMLARLSSGPFVSVAAIDGVCVGGGAELAVWCDRRVLSNSPRTELGFPEVKLGLIPGWGGTVRTPRIIGLSNAVEMITTGESVDAATAMAMGLADDLVPPDRLVSAAIQMIRDEHRHQRFLDDRAKRSASLSLPSVELDFLRGVATAKIQRSSAGANPAPKVALELMLACADSDAATACEREAEAMTQVFGSPANIALVNVFFLNDRAKKDTGLDHHVSQQQSLKSVGLIGAGVMGAGIAAASIKRELNVSLTDASADALARGVQAVVNEVSYDKKQKRPTLERATRFAPYLNSSPTLESLSTCDLVLEAIVENIDVKRQMFAKLEPLLREDAILASNTSTFPITKLAEKLERPERFCGIHFFNPVRRMQLVEVIRGEKTSDETVAAAVSFTKRIGKLPIVVKDGPGFLVNRMLASYMNEALELLSIGVPLETVDQAARDFGMPIGPFGLYDIVGIDTAFYAGRSMWEAFPDRTIASPILPALVKAGRLGLKNGLGFYSYQNKKQEAEPDPRVAALIEVYLRGKQQLSSEELQDRLVLPMFLEATRILQEGRVRDARDVDIGQIFGLGFPSFRGGLLFWADTVGIAEILRRVRQLEPLGPRFHPTPLLVEMARTGEKFYH